MKTAIIQSAPPNRPAWVATCLESVRSWAVPRFDYFFAGDELFDRIDETRRDVLLKHSDKAPLSDLGRLLWAKELLSHGYCRVIWLDSDVYVFNQDAFTAGLPEDTAFCQETWFSPRLIAPHQYRFAVNNAVMTLCDTPAFHTYLQHMVERIDSGGTTKRLSIGPLLLSDLHAAHSLRLIRHVPSFSDPVQHSFVTGGRIHRQIMRCQGHPAAALHLCLSQADKAQLASDTIARLRADHGRSLNRDLSLIPDSYFEGLAPYSHVNRSGRLLFSFASWIRSLRAKT